MALFMSIVAKVAEEGSIECGGRVTFKERKLKKAESCLFLGGTIISPG